MKYTPKLRRKGNPQVPEQGGSSGPAGWTSRCCGGCGGDRDGTALTATCGAPARWLTEGSTLCMSWEWGSSKRWGTKAASPCRLARKLFPSGPGRQQARWTRGGGGRAQRREPGLCDESNQPAPCTGEESKPLRCRKGKRRVHVNSVSQPVTAPGTEHINAQPCVRRFCDPGYPEPRGSGAFSKLTSPGLASA